MPLIKVGSCSHCGKCCLSMKLGGLMVENPMIDLDEDRCKFYVMSDGYKILLPDLTIIPKVEK
ncbi:unnamed protein product [marine sediment metagenome]|uniref:Uncharacterized protein n=1 Tax=marine sediment metagenome TaxID=412755 RepID=X1S085_9ZZZZ